MLNTSLAPIASSSLHTMPSSLRSALRDATIVDFRCGQLIYGRAFAGQLIRRFCGLDLDLQSLHLAAEHAPPDLPLTLVRCGVGGRAPFADASVDVVISSEVIEHLDDPASHLAEINRILKPGGTLSLSTPCGSMYHQPSQLLRAGRSPSKFRGWLDRIQSHKHWSRALSWHPALMPRILRSWVESSGFSVCQHETRLWYYCSRLALSQRFFTYLERIGVPGVGATYEKYLHLTDRVLTHKWPILRWLGTRQFILCRKET